MFASKHLAAAIAVLSAALWPPQAPAAPVAPEAFAAVPIERMCAPGGVLGYRFGATDAPAKPLALPGTTDMRLGPEFAPFEHAGIDSTKWSERVYAANYVAELPDQESALALIAELARRYEQRGWTAERWTSVEEADARTTITHIAPGPGEVHLYWPAGATGPDRKEGVRIELTRLGNEVTFSCTDLALFGDHVAETFGQLPEGIPRPIEPVLAIPTQIDPDTCENPAKRAALAASRPEDSELMRYVHQRSRYRERLVTWKMDRLKKAGGLSEEQAMEIAMTALADPAAAQGLEASLELLTAMFADLEKVIAAEAANDEIGACTALLALLARFDAIGAAVDPQWDAMEAAIDREAQRLGVEFE